MIKVISIGTDRKVFEKGSVVSARLEKQEKLFAELHVIVFSLRSHGLKIRQEGTVWFYPTNSLSRFMYVYDAIALARGLIRERKMKKENTVITTQDPFECGLAGLIVSRLMGVPLHVQVHTDFLNPFFRLKSLLNWIRAFLARIVLPRAKAVRVVSERIQRSFEEHGITLRAPVSVLPVYIDMKRFRSVQGTFNLHDRYGHDAFVILMASRFASEKELPHALEVFEKLSSAREMQLVIVGEGPEREHLLGLIQAKGLSGSVHIEPWQTDLAAYYKSADVFLVTSRFEGYGLTLLEAAVSACPIVSTDVGIARALVPKEYERFVCPVGGRDCLAQGLEELSRDEPLRVAYARALQNAAEKFTYSEQDYYKHYLASIMNALSA